MTLREVVSLAPGVKVEPASEGRCVVTRRGKLMLRPVSPGVDAAFEALCAGGHSLEELAQLASRDGVVHAALFHSMLKSLGLHGTLARVLQLEGTVLATLAPAAVQGAPPAPKEGVRYGVSRFAFTHMVDGVLVLETPLAEGRVWMTGWQGPALLGALTVPRSPAEFAGVVPGIPHEAAAAFLRMLMEAGVLVELRADGTPMEPESLATWEFHDLLFHRQSRWGHREGMYGGATYRFRGRLPEPARKPPDSGEKISLEVPDLSEVERRDPPFTAVVERHRSIRAHGSKPVTRAQLAELLYRAVGLRRVVFPGRGEQEARPYPGGGALYETEVYLIVNQCEGLEPGLYHYRVEEHALYRMSGLTPNVEPLLKAAMPGALFQAPPQMMVVLTARFARVAWKYETMAYAVMLKHVGVIVQTLYLVATAMGLAPCGLGGGSAELFAQASGLDPFVEGSVGELILGSRPE